VLKNKIWFVFPSLLELLKLQSVYSFDNVNYPCNSQLGKTKPMWAAKAEQGEWPHTAGLWLLERTRRLKNRVPDTEHLTLKITLGVLTFVIFSSFTDQVTVRNTDYVHLTKPH